MGSAENQKPHAIMVCFHLQGHINPFVNLAVKLASKGFSFTFAHLYCVHHQISNSAAKVDIFAASCRFGLDIHYTTIGDGFPLDFDRSFRVEYMEFFLHEFADRVDELVAGILDSDSSSTLYNYFLIVDTLCIWHEKIAKKYGLVNVSFWTEPVIVFSLYYHLELLKEKGHVPVKGGREVVDYVPEIESINTRHFKSFLQDTQPQLTQDIIFGAFDSVKSVDFVLCNTVQELEADTISVL